MAGSGTDWTWRDPRAVLTGLALAGRACSAGRCSLRFGVAASWGSLLSAGGDSRALSQFYRDHGCEMRARVALVYWVPLVTVFFRSPDRLMGQMVESAWSAVPGLLPVRFSRPLAEPAVPVSRQRALHGISYQAWLTGAQGLGILLPR